MQTDGNLVLYDTSGQPNWASKTQGNPGAFLNVQNDGNLVVYRAGSTTQTANNALWEAGNSALTLKTVVASGDTLNVGVVNNGAMLNVGNANLTYLSYDMPFGQDCELGRPLGALHRAGLLVGPGRPNLVPGWAHRDR